MPKTTAVPERICNTGRDLRSFEGFAVNRGRRRSNSEAVSR